MKRHLENLDHRRGPTSADPLAQPGGGAMFKVIINFTDGRPPTTIETADKRVAVVNFNDALERSDGVANVYIGAVPNGAPPPVHVEREPVEKPRRTREGSVDRGQREKRPREPSPPRREVEPSPPRARKSKRQLEKGDIDQANSLRKELLASVPTGEDDDLYERRALLNLAIETLEDYLETIALETHGDLLSEWRGVVHQCRSELAAIKKKTEAYDIE